MGIIDSIKFKISEFNCSAKFESIVNKFSSCKSFSCPTISAIFAKGEEGLSCWKTGSATKTENAFTDKVLSLCNDETADFESELEPLLNQIRAEKPYALSGILGRAIDTVAMQTGSDAALLRFLENKKLEAGSLMAQKRSPYLKTAALVALPIFAFLAWSVWSLKSSPVPPIQLDPIPQPNDPVKAPLKPLVNDTNETFNFSASKTFMSECPDAMQSFLVQSKTADTQNFITYCEVPSFEATGFQAPLENAGISLAVHPDLFANRSDCPAERENRVSEPKVCLESRFLTSLTKQSGTLEEIQDHIINVKEKKNYHEALDSFLKASNRAMEEIDDEKQVSPSARKLMTHASCLAEILVMEGVDPKEIIELIQVWAKNDQFSVFNFNASNIMNKFIEKEMYLEVFNTSQFFKNELYTSSLLRDLIGKDVLLLEILEFTHERIRSGRYHFMDGVLKSLIQKGIGHTETIELFQKMLEKGDESIYLRYQNSLEALAEVRKAGYPGNMEIAQIFVQNPLLQNQAFAFFNLICDGKRMCPKAGAAIRAILPSIKDPSIVQKLNGLIK